MMTLDTLRQLRPQRTFLIAGSARCYADLVRAAGEATTNLYTLSVARFTIDDAKDIAEVMREGNGEERYVIVYFSVFSPDAAEALLKALEESDGSTTLLWVTPYPYIVPLTIRSRLTFIADDTASVLAKPDTIAHIVTDLKKELADDAEMEAAIRRARALTLLDRLETACRREEHKARLIYSVKGLLLRANMPVKFVMEYVIATIA